MVTQPLNRPAAASFPVLERLTESPWFRHTILGFIVLAGIVVGLETSSSIMSRWGTQLLALDRLVMAVFALELGLRLGAHLPNLGRFFRDPWNLFDFVIVTVCLLPVGGQFTAVLRLARVLRLLRVVSALPRLQFLIAALFKSLGSMGYVGLLLMLLFYMYAVIGVSAFGAGDAANFGSIPVAMLTLFRIITLEGWVEVMNAQFAAGVSGAAVVVYFISFILIGTMIMLNLFIGIILNGMTEMQAETDERRGLDGLAAIDHHLRALQQEVAKLRAHHGERP